MHLPMGLRRVTSAADCFSGCSAGHARSSPVIHWVDASEERSNEITNREPDQEKITQSPDQLSFGSRMTKGL